MTKTLFALLLISLLSTTCALADYKPSKDGFSANANSYFFVGAEPDTVATELLGYFAKAALANSTLVLHKQGRAGYNGYSAGNISVYDASFITPPRAVEIMGQPLSTSTFRQSDGPGVTKQSSEPGLWVCLAPDTALTLISVLQAAGVPWRPELSMKNTRQYRGENLWCDVAIDEQGLNVSRPYCCIRATI